MAFACGNEPAAGEVEKAEESRGGENAAGSRGAEAGACTEAGEAQERSGPRPGVHRAAGEGYWSPCCVW